METLSSSKPFENTSTKFDLSFWTDTLRSATNLTHYAPSAKDLLMAGPRMGLKIGSFFFKMPEAIDDVLGGRLGQRVIPEATGIVAGDAVTTAGIASQIVQAGAEMVGDADDVRGGLTSKLSMESSRSLGNILQYTTSKWSLCCIVMAIVLNRTYIYASTRRNLSIGWKIRLALRIIPIVLFTIQVRWLLQSMQCQTSPDFGMLRWGNASKSSDLLFTQNGGRLHTISSTLLFGASDAESCRAVMMVPPAEDTLGDEKENGIVDLSGSLGLLWPLFKTFCFSQFIETLSCAVQGRQVAAETGMTLFEHSLAFAEADAAVSSSLGWGPFGGTLPSGAQQRDSMTPSETAIRRSMIMKRINTPPEVLLVGFLSSMNHITSHILGVFNLQGRLRLVSTAFWALCFMSTITWSIINFSVDDLANQSLLRFPTVCIIGFIPHVLVLAGIILCSIIYGLALVLTAASPPTDLRQQVDERTFFQRLASAHNNMQANVPLSNIRISMHMDFYTALLKTGFSALTMASEAVYLNESSEVTIKQQTWLEDDRLREMEESGVHWLGPNFRNSPGGLDGNADGVGLVASREQPSDSTLSSLNGFARERTAQKTPKLKATDKVIRDGVGAAERSGRWIMAFELFVRIAKLVVHWWATLALKILARFGVQTRPRWLTWLVTRPKRQIQNEVNQDLDPETLDFWLVGADGELVLPSDDRVDVEAEMRKRLQGDKLRWSPDDEQNLDANLYGWWLSGGWWGGDDSSGNFTPSNKDEDATSIISASTSYSEEDWESDDNSGEDGSRTPTQHSPQYSRDTTPVLDLPLSSVDLAQLLHPKTPEHRAEAQALSAHLASNAILTRSRYRELYQRERAKVLTSTRRLPAEIRRSATAKLTPEEETEILEYLITSRRAFQNATAASSPAGPSSWAEGASGMGESGPQCVVCQSAPRSIIVWPCRCLSLCDDCRVTLAMNNFDKCVCCRRDVGSFSRIFVP